MPEMPEVETIKRIIEPQIVGVKIDSVITNHSQVIAYPDMYRFEQETNGQTINKMSRSFCIFPLSVHTLLNRAYSDTPFPFLPDIPVVTYGWFQYYCG